jgi:hypothetical protein
MSEQIIIASVTKMAKGLCIGGYILPHGWWPSDFTPLGPVRSVRLIPAGELWHPYTNEWKPGQIINAVISERANLIPPHTEDVTLTHWATDGCTTWKKGMHAATARCDCSRQKPPKTFPLILREIAMRDAHEGSVHELFQGKISRKENGRAFVADHTLTHSTQWWVPGFYATASDNGYRPIRIESSQYQNAAILEALAGDGWAGSPDREKFTFKYVGVNPVCKRKVYDHISPADDHTLVCRMSLARWWAAPSDQEKLCYADLSAVWAASHDRSSFVPLECDSPGADGQCVCEVPTEDEQYCYLWGLPFSFNQDLSDDLPF